MSNSKRDLKGYVRVDGENRIVSGSLVLRRSKPKVGNWIEIPAYECCNPTTTTTTTIGGFPLIIEWDDIANIPVTNASSVSEWNTFFNLPTNGTPFTSVVVVDNNVELYGGSDINLTPYLFIGTSHIVSFVDMSGCITTAGEYCFNGCPTVTTFNLPSLTTAGIECFAYCTSATTFNLPSLTTADVACFAGCTSATTFNLPSLTTAGIECFASCESATTFNLPSLTTAGNICFISCTSATTFNLPECTNLGPNVGDDSVFEFIFGNTITATFNNILATCNGGFPDGDIQYLTGNNTVTITYV